MAIAPQPHSTIQILQTPTTAAWVEQAIAHLDTVLLDHAHCDRKAAGVAFNLICRYPSNRHSAG